MYKNSICLKILFVLIIAVTSIEGISLYSKTKYFQTEIAEEVHKMPLEVQGTLPNWLKGALVRNSSIPVYKEGRHVSHELDGIAMLHSFNFNDGKVSYSNRFLLSEAHDSVVNRDSIDYDGFSSIQSFWTKLRNYFTGSANWVMNASVNVFKYGREYVALTEAPGPACFDINTLETQGTFAFQDDLPKSQCYESAHPHFDFASKETLNYLIEFGRESCYVLYRMQESSSKREVIAKIPVETPAYMHSFAMTQHYVIFVEYPLVVKPLDLLLSTQSYMYNFKWKPELGTRFLVVERSTGKLVSQAYTDTFFSWHHANAFESENGDELMIDLVAIPDLSAMYHIFPWLSTGVNGQPWSTRLMRYHYSLENNEIESEILLEKDVEFPRIDDRLDGKPYLYMYLTVSNRVDGESKQNELGKFDLGTKQLITWSESGYEVLEPVFVPSPEAKSEDDGLVMTVISDEKKNSFLVVLDGRTFKEIARAKMPWHIPCSFHGQFFSESTFSVQE